MINNRVYKILLAICAVIAVLLFIFNVRTQIPFSIGVRVFQIPFFVAFFIAFVMGGGSWALISRRLSHDRRSADSAQIDVKSKQE